MRALAVSACLLLAGCQLGLGPLPAEVQALSDYLVARNLRLTPDATAYDRAFDSVDPDAHVVSYRVTAPQPGPRPEVALVDVYRFGGEAARERGVAGLRRIHDRGRLYGDGRLVLHVRGSAPQLDLLLGRRYGAAVQV